MSDRRLAQAVRQIRRLARPPAVAPADDRALLASFAASRDEAAFAELVRRHGPLVRGVCRRVLGDADAADDVFQATFLVLARKAGAVRWRAAVGPWLYAVAYRLARKARSRSSCLRFAPADSPRARNVNTVADPAVTAAWRELCHILDEELSRLPDRLRGPLVLCYLDGRTRDEAAAALGWTLATLKRRLERGRTILRQRLERRGLTAGLLAVAVEPAAVPAELSAATAAAAVSFANGGTMAGPVAALLGSGSRVVRLTLLAGVIAVAASGVALAPRVLAPAPDTNLGALTQPRSPEADQFGDPLPAGAVARLGTLAFRHGDIVRQLLQSPNSQSIISLGSGAVRIWSADSGRQLGVIGPPEWTHFVAGSFLSGGNQLALSYADGNIRIWDWRTLREVRSFTIGLRAHRVMQPARFAHAPDGRSAALLDSDGSVRLVDLVAGRETHELSGHGKPVTAMAFAPDGKVLVTAGEDRSIRTWDVTTGRETNQIASPVGLVVTLALSPDGNWLAFGGGTRRESGTASWTRSDRHVRVWDLGLRREVHQLDAGQYGAAALLFSGDSRSLIVGSYGADGRTVRQWDLTTGKEFRRFPGHGNAVGALALTPDGRTLLTADSVVHVWDWPTGRERTEAIGHPGAVYSALFLPDGRTVIAGGNGGGLRHWDAATGRQLRQFAGPDDSIHPIALAPDRQTLLAVTDTGTAQSLSLWKVEAARKVRELSLPARGVSDAVFAPDGRSLAAASYGDNTVRVWDYPDLKERLKVPVRPSGGLSFAADGRTLRGISGDDRTVFSIDTGTGKLTEQGSLGATDYLYAISYAPDGRFVAAAGERGGPGGGVPAQGERGVIRLCDAATGTVVREFTGVWFGVSRTAFSPDGKLIASGGWRSDPTVVVWDVATGKRLREFAGHRGRITALSFSPDGKRLASGSDDTAILIWDVSEVRPAVPN